MSLHLQRDLDRLHRALLSQAGRVEHMIDDSVKALCNRRYELISDIFTQDDVIDKDEVLLEEECLKLLALHQPVASDLRRISTILKLNVDLERIADLGGNIAERADCLRAFPYFPTPEDLPSMAENACLMLRRGLDAFVNLNSAEAYAVIEMESRVDQQYRDIILELEELIRTDPNQVKPALHAFSAARHLEQIADHAQDIAEEVIYMIDGEIVRHKHLGHMNKKYG